MTAALTIPTPGQPTPAPAASQPAGFDCGQLTDDQRRELAERKRIVDAWQAARSAGIRGIGGTIKCEEAMSVAFLAGLEINEGVKLSRRTLFRWAEIYRCQGLAGLVDGRWLQEASEETDPFLAEVQRLYLLRGKTLRLSVCHTMATLTAEQNGWAPRSYAACRRAIKKIPKGVLLKRRHGTEAFVNGAEPFQPRDYSTLRSNEVWIGDHHEMDVMVIFPDGRIGRPWLTAWEDGRSRLIPGWAMFGHDPNSDTILESFRRGVTVHGVPENVLIDNGRDYKSQALGGVHSRKTRTVHVEYDPKQVGGVFGMLGVGKTHCLPYRPQSKPIERFFTTVETRFCPLFETYCGNSTANKPERLAELVKAGKCPTLADFTKAFGDWLEADYHQRPHFGDSMAGQTPAAVFAANLEVKRTASQAALDVMCLRPSRPTKVTRNGVRFHGLAYNDRKLSEHLGKEVLLRVDDRDRSAVLVFTLEDRFICRAESVKSIPFRASSEEVRAAHRAKAAVRRTVREYCDASPRMMDDLPDAMIRARAEQNRKAAAGQPTPPGAGPARIQPIRSPIEQDLPAIQKAVEDGKQRPAKRAAAAAQSKQVWDVLMERASSFAQERKAKEEKEEADRIASQDNWKLLARSAG